MRAISPYLSIILALVLGFAAYASARPTLAFVKGAQPAEAKVVGVHPCRERPPPGSRSNLDGFAECADIQFRAASGREVSAGVRGWPGRATKGEKIDVLYDPQHPEWCMRDGVLDLWWIPGLLGVFAALILVRGTAGLGRGYS
ncbi:MAG TPA: DUF3592 domain-containing protein [Myxococcales bacterium]|nr:DUF3592 domain-containing protein [Myxococcales bacterium]